MSLLDVQLFIGLELTPDLRRALSRADSKLVDYFIDNGQDYLTRVSLDSRRFLAKPVDKLTQMEQLELMENNLRSLCQRLLPDVDLSSHPSLLFATQS